MTRRETAGHAQGSEFHVLIGGEGSALRAQKMQTARLEASVTMRHIRDGRHGAFQRAASGRPANVHKAVCLAASCFEVSR